MPYKPTQKDAYAALSYQFDKLKQEIVAFNTRPELTEADTDRAHTLIFQRESAFGLIVYYNMEGIVTNRTAQKLQILHKSIPNVELEPAAHAWTEEELLQFGTIGQ